MDVAGISRADEWATRLPCVANLMSKGGQGLERAREPRSQGYSVAQAVKILNAEGFMCEGIGKRKPRPITEWVLAKTYASEGVKLLDHAAPVELAVGETTTSFERFAGE